MSSPSRHNPGQSARTIDEEDFSALVGRKILIVDDDPAIRKVLRKHLEARGSRVWTAAEGSEAITLFEEHGADLIIMDVIMPGEDGFAVCETIKRSHDVPVIFLTGAQDSIVKNYLPQMVAAAGGNRFLRKPFDARELLTLINETLRDSTPA